VIEKHQIDRAELARRVQTLDRRIATSDFDFDDVCEACQLHERHDDGCELWGAFEGEVAVAAGGSHRCAGVDAAVADVTAQFDL
jgi:hypothetical protein